MTSIIYFAHLIMYSPRCCLDIQQLQTRHQCVVGHRLGKGVSNHDVFQIQFSSENIGEKKALESSRFALTGLVFGICHHTSVSVVSFLEGGALIHLFTYKDIFHIFLFTSILVHEHNKKSIIHYSLCYFTNTSL